jgi:single-strand DNA-binding protein
MNKVFLSGNITRDPEVRYSNSGKAFTKMGIAVRRQFSKDKDAVDFFNLVAFDKTAEFCGRYMLKGTRVLVEGRLQTSSYEAQDGSKRTSTEIMVDNIEFAGSKQRSDEGGGGGGNNYSRSSNNGYSERNLPAPPKKNDDYDIGGEPIDPEDTPF